MKTSVLTTMRNGEILLASLAYFPNLPYFIHYLDLYDSCGKLTWHDGAVPNTNIWVKLGGNHGGGSVQLVMQIGSVEHPSFQCKTLFVCVLIVMSLMTQQAICILTGYLKVKSRRALLHNYMERKENIVLFFFGHYEC